jgi:hypothetical protein
VILVSGDGAAEASALLVAGDGGVGAPPAAAQSNLPLACGSLMRQPPKGWGLKDGRRRALVALPVIALEFNVSPRLIRHMCRVRPG